MRAVRRRLEARGASNVDVTAFLSLMVILVPFLLITAVFSRMTILELQGAPGGQEAALERDPLGLQVLVRSGLIEVRYRGQEQPTRLTRSPDGAEYQRLADLAADLKRRFPQSSDVTVLLEPQIPYEAMIQVVDAVRVRQERTAAGATYVELFPDIALGETPAVGSGGGSGG